MSLCGKGKNGVGVSKYRSKVRKLDRVRERVRGTHIMDKSKVSGVYRCVACNSVYTEPNHILFKGMNLILCPTCDDMWVFYSGRGYIRKRDIQDRWKAQRELTDIFIEIFGSRYVVDEVRFPKWAISPRGGLLSFDIAVPKYDLLADYMGIQHVEYPNKFHNSIAEYEYQRKCDKVKLELCPSNGWNYITFNYNEPTSIEWVRRRLTNLLGDGVIDG